jgi:hypothetical protein
MKRIVEIADDNSAQEIVSCQSKPLRCDKCKWWETLNWEIESRPCLNPEIDKKMLDDNRLYTPPNFYCKFWEAKEE